MNCKFKNSLGTPRSGVHKQRIAGLALFDIIGTIILAYFTSKIYKIRFFKSFIILLLLAEILHVVFCVDTALIKYFEARMWDNLL